MLRRWRAGRAALLPDLGALPVLYGLLRGGAGRGRGGVPAGGGLPDPGGRAGRRRPARGAAGGVRRARWTTTWRCRRRWRSCTARSGRATRPWRRGTRHWSTERYGEVRAMLDVLGLDPLSDAVAGRAPRRPRPAWSTRWSRVALDQRAGGPAAARTTPRPTPSAPGSPRPASPSRTPPAVHAGHSRILRERAPAPECARATRRRRRDRARAATCARHGVRAAAGRPAGARR